MASNGLGMSTPHTQQSPMSMASMASMANMASMPSTPMKSPQVGMAGSKGDFIYIKHEVRKHLVVFYCNFVFFHLHKTWGYENLPLLIFLLFDGNFSRSLSIAYSSIFAFHYVWPLFCILICFIFCSTTIFFVFLEIHLKKVDRSPDFHASAE